VSITVREAAKKLDINLKGASVAIQGFGNAGQFAGVLLAELGMKVIAVSDSKGAVLNREGISVDSLRNHKLKNGTVSGFQNASPLHDSELLALDCTVLVPAALENQITNSNAGNVKAKIVAEAANGPTTPDADDILFKNNVLVIPDILANGGGVTVSYFEWLQNLRREYWSEDEVNNRLDSNISSAFNDVYTNHKKFNVNMRKASTLLAVNRVVEAMKIRGLWP
jgi:glutamate dehydrogenase/leucine dehydrogenase